MSVRESKVRRFWWLVLVGVLLVAPAAVEAQVIQYFFLPVDVVGNARGPSYLKWRFNPEGLDVLWSCRDYGKINDVMMCVVEADAADRAWLSEQADVYTWPTALDENLPQAERSAVTAYLEAAFVPANWISPSDTRRESLRTITGMFLYMQSVTGLAGNPLGWGITLNTQFNSLSLVQQVALEQAALNLGYAWDVAPNDLIRNILKTMGDALEDQPIFLGFTTL